MSNDEGDDEQEHLDEGTNIPKESRISDLGLNSKEVQRSQ